MTQGHEALCPEVSQLGHLERDLVIDIEQPPAETRGAIPSLRANFAWTFAGIVLYAGCQWGMLSVLAKLGSPSIVGQFTLGLAICAPVFMFTNLQLRAVQATDVNAETGFGVYFTLRLLATLLGLLLIVALLPFAGASPAVRRVILLVAVSKSIECMSDVTAGLLQREEQLKRVAISLMIRGVGSVLVFSVTFASWQNLALSLAAMSGVWLAVLLFYDVPNATALIGRHEGLFRFDAREMRRLLVLSLPLGWVATLTSLNMNIPRYFLQHDLGAADQGIYASLAYLIVGINLIAIALSQSATTRLAAMFASGNLKGFKHLLWKFSMVGVLIAVAGAPLALLVGRPVLEILYRPEYGDHSGLLAVFVVIAGLLTIGCFLLCGLSAARLFRAQIPVYFAATAVAVTASAILIPRSGLIGGGIALLLSSLTVVVGCIWALRPIMDA
jgi:O-antigen/teichoic acid export membrane protein